MSYAWTLETEGPVGHLTFDMPDEKVNMLNTAAMTELESVLDGLTDGKLSALVIRSGKKSGFIAGADIKELARITDAADAAAKSKAGHTIFGKLAALPMPTVAVIHGPCLGGGLELALACTFRLVTDHEKTSLGLPEVNLGILPGWGGTIRLPKVVGLAPALKMILAGKPVDARRALRMGLADAVAAPAFVDDQTMRFVERVTGAAGRREVLRRRRTRQRLLMRLLAATPPGRALMYRGARRQIEKRTRGHYPAPLEALAAVRASYRRRRAEAETIEQETFAKLACTPISRNLVRLFQAGLRLKKAGRPEKKLEPVRHCGVAGAGIMGGGIAWALSNAGVQVRLKDINWEALARGMAAAAGMYRGKVKRRRMTRGAMNLAMHRISPTVDWTGFGRVDAVIEAVAEDLEIKRTVLAEIERCVSPETIICTNTSSLSLSDLASGLEHPERFVGMHFFNPVNLMPLVEVVPGPQTSDETVVRAAELVRRIGKTPMVVGDCAGFLVNRILLPYLVESAWMFEEGTDARRIDRVLEQFGMPMGPLALVDEVGLDVGYKVAKVLEDAYGPRMHVPRALGDVAATNLWLGRKTGAGFYKYRNGRKRPNRRVLRLARAARKQDGVTARDLTDEDILDRAILIMVNEAARCLEEGIVDDPESLDMAMVMGTGFAPFRGGLLRYADERGVAEIRTRLEELAGTYGDRFTAAPLIEQIAGNGGHFHREQAV